MNVKLIHNLQHRVILLLSIGIMVLGATPTTAHAAALNCSGGFADTFLGNGSLAATNWEAAGFKRVSDRLYGEETLNLNSESHLYTTASFAKDVGFEITGRLTLSNKAVVGGIGHMVVGLTAVPGFSTEGAYFYVETYAAGGTYVGYFDADGNPIRVKFYATIDNLAHTFRLASLNGDIYAFFDPNGDGLNAELFGKVATTSTEMFGHVLLGGFSDDPLHRETKVSFEASSAKIGCATGPETAIL